MITKTLKTVNGPLKITIPGDISEVTMGILAALTPKPGYSFSQLEQLSILSGIPMESDETNCLYDLCNIDDIHTFDVTLQKIAYQITAFDADGKVPAGVTLDIPHTHTKKWYSKFRKHTGKYVPVSKNLGIQPAGAYMEAKELIKSEFEEYDRVKKELGTELVFSPSVDSMIRLLSLYLFVPATGEKFNMIKIMEFDEVIKKLPMVKGLPIAKCFFLKYPNLSKPRAKP